MDSRESKTKNMSIWCKNDIDPKLGGMIHYTIRNRFRTSTADYPDINAQAKIVITFKKY